jgi:hypothetical protein
MGDAKNCRFGIWGGGYGENGGWGRRLDFVVEADSGCAWGMGGSGGYEECEERGLRLRLVTLQAAVLGGENPPFFNFFSSFLRPLLGSFIYSLLYLMILQQRSR